MICVVVFHRSFDGFPKPSPPAVSDIVHCEQMEILQKFLHKIATTGIFGVDKQVEKVYQGISDFLIQFAQSFALFTFFCKTQDSTFINISVLLNNIFSDLSFIDSDLGDNFMDWAKKQYDFDSQNILDKGLSNCNWLIHNDTTFFPQTIHFFELSSDNVSDFSVAGLN